MIMDGYFTKPVDSQETMATKREDIGDRGGTCFPSIVAMPIGAVTSGISEKHVKHSSVARIVVQSMARAEQFLSISCTVLAATYQQQPAPPKAARDGPRHTAESERE